MDTLPGLHLKDHEALPFSRSHPVSSSLYNRILLVGKAASGWNGIAPNEW